MTRLNRNLLLLWDHIMCVVVCHTYPHNIIRGKSWSSNRKISRIRWRETDFSMKRVTLWCHGWLLYDHIFLRHNCFTLLWAVQIWCTMGPHKFWNNHHMYFFSVFVFIKISALHFQAIWESKILFEDGFKTNY